MRADLEAVDAFTDQLVERVKSARSAKSSTSNVTQVNGLKIEIVMATRREPELAAALDGLIDDYNALRKGG